VNLNDLFSNMGGTMVFTMAATIVPFVLIAVGLLIWALRGRGKAKGAQNWPYAMGTVLHANVEARRSSNGRGGTSTSYYPVVVYEYEVLGHRYHSSKLNFAAIGYGMSSMAEAKAAPYLPGNRVTVYYDPNEPGNAVLERNAPGSSVLLWVVLLIIVILTFTVAVMLGAFGMMGDILGSTFGDILTRVPN
jgi:Protein of unknown function (DUF3592)